MSKRNGLALIIALLAALALASAAVILASYCLTAGIESEAAHRRALLRQAAEAAALRGLAELQAGVGPDARFTYPDTAGALHGSGSRESRQLDGEAWLDALKLSWSFRDFSMAYDRAAGAVARGKASDWAKGLGARPRLPQALPAEVTLRQQRALLADAPDFFEEVPSAGGSWQTRGLLTDPVRGGWRRDFSVPTELAHALGPALGSALNAEHWKRPPGKGYPLGHVVSEERSLSTVPVLTDLRLSLGFFNSRHDGRHRLRFHGSGVLWNPLTVPVLAGPQGRLFLVEVVGAPEISVTNLEAGSGFVVDLDDAPQVDFGVVRQGAREKGLWFWTEVTDPRTYGMAGRGLLPGEVFAFEHPAAEVQPQGLARILSEQTWRMDRRPVSPRRRRPGPDTFFPDDPIEITARFNQKMSIRLRAYAGEPGRDEVIAAYAGPPLIVLDNISFPDFRLRMTGADYSREDSAGYVIDDRRACLRVRWRPRPAPALREAMGGLLRTHWDLARPADAAEWSIESPLLAALDVVDHDASPWAGPLWDLRANQHNAPEAASFAAWRLRDIPTWPMVSVGSLRHLEGPEGRAWVGLLDQAFFSARPALVEAGVDSHQPFLEACPTSTESAAGWRIIGPWNVNSRDPREWEAFLRGSMGAWRSEAGGPFPPSLLQGALFFTRPSGAGQPHWGALSALDLPDEAMATLDAHAADAQQVAQAVRKIPEERLRVWAQAIVRLQSECGWPYPSLEALAVSPLLTRSLAEAGINDVIEPTSVGMPLRLEAADLMEAWAPILCVRGDTFMVTGRAEGVGGVSLCEMTVQRVAEVHPGPGLGRKFRIISVRFRNP